MSKQRYTSANTSINSTKMPRIYNLINVNEEETVIDYGCGKYFDTYHLGHNFFGYDPFNRNIPELLQKHYDIAICSNVLNVIAEQEVRYDVLKKLKEIANKVFITVYEGDGSRNSRVTKDDCYQLNWKKRDFMPELVDVFGVGNVKLKNGYFECEVI